MSQVWARVRSKGTGHHFDVSLERLEILLERGAVEEVPGRRHTGQANPPKFRRNVPPVVPIKRAAKAIPAEAVADLKEELS